MLNMYRNCKFSSTLVLAHFAKHLTFYVHTYTSVLFSAQFQCVALIYRFNKLLLSLSHFLPLLHPHSRTSVSVAGMSGANNVDGSGGGCLSSSSSSPPLPQCSGVGGGAGSGGSGGGDLAAVVPATATGGEDSPTPSECAAAAAAAVVSSSMTHHGGIGTAAGVDVGKEGVGTGDGGKEYCANGINAQSKSHGVTALLWSLER